MLGLLVIMVISWVVLRFIQKENLTALGIFPNQKRMGQFFLGFTGMLCIVLLTIYIETAIADIQWRRNDETSYVSLWNATIYHLKSALTEDLVFRGALLYILIKRAGHKIGLFSSAICFGAYHVFSYGMTGSHFIPILYVILVTGITGYIWAYLFYKTGSIMMPLGLHLGYNLTMSMFFENQPYGEMLFMEITRMDLAGWNQFFLLFIRGFFPSIITILIIQVSLMRSKRLKNSRANQSTSS